MTPQRGIILRLLAEAGAHMTARHLLAKLQEEQWSAADVSTVYRTLELAEELGLVARFERPGCDTEFEWVRTPHHHLVCTSCAAILTLEHSMLTSLESPVLERTGFVVDARHLAVGGTCAACVAQLRAPQERNSPSNAEENGANHGVHTARPRL